MQNDKRTTRSLAIEWWDELSEVGMINAVSKYHNIPFEDAKQGYHEIQGQYSDAFILTIYLSEHPEQPIKEDTLTKDEAIEAMLKGYKVTHQYFTDSEWAKLNGHFEIEFEDGCKIKVDDFWRDRKGEEWQMGWSIFAEPIKEQSSNRGEGDILEGGGEKEGTTQRVATALLNHAVSEHKFVSDYTQKEKQMFRSGFIHGDVQGNESGCIWGLEQGRKENQALKESNTRLKEALKRIAECEGLPLDKYDAEGFTKIAKEALTNNNPK